MTLLRKKQSNPTIKKSRDMVVTITRLLLLLQVLWRKGSRKSRCYIRTDYQRRCKNKMKQEGAHQRTEPQLVRTQQNKVCLNLMELYSERRVVMTIGMESKKKSVFNYYHYKHFSQVYETPKRHENRVQLLQT